MREYFLSPISIYDLEILVRKCVRAELKVKKDNNALSRFDEFTRGELISMGRKRKLKAKLCVPQLEFPNSSKKSKG